jgi:hypothetical protein
MMNPSMPMATPATDEPEPTEEPPAGEASESGGYTICVTCKPDGSFEVYKEDAEEEASEPAGQAEAMEPPAGEPARQSVDSLEEALKQVIRIHKQNPMDQSYSGQMSAGFQGENTTPY